MLAMNYLTALGALWPRGFRDQPHALLCAPTSRWARRPGVCLFFLPSPRPAVATQLWTPGFPKPLPASLRLWGTGGHIVGRVFLAALACDARC